jgi:tripartite-type tricarboxylate transporter receptor subunit TctC
MFAPKGTPQPVVEKIHAALNRALKDPETSKKLVALGSEVVVSPTSADFGVFVKQNYDLWGELVKISGIERQ